MGIRILMRNTFLVLKIVNPSEFSLNMGAQGRIRNHKKRVAQKDHDNFVAVVVCLFVCVFVFCGWRLRFRVIPKSTLNTKFLPITGLVLVLGSSSLDRNPRCREYLLSNISSMRSGVSSRDETP